LAAFAAEVDDGGHVGGVGEEVPDQNTGLILGLEVHVGDENVRYKGKADTNCTESPLRVHWFERFEESKDECIAEATKQ
jgi:hypothetical protein